MWVSMGVPSKSSAESFHKIIHFGAPMEIPTPLAIFHPQVDLQGLLHTFSGVALLVLVVVVGQHVGIALFPRQWVNSSRLPCLDYSTKP